MNQDEKDIIASLCRSSFEDFVKEFWEQVPGAGKLVWNWHMSYICAELQKEAFRVKAGKPREYDLVINISPGTSKSSICSILFQPWTWTFFPEARHISASHTQSLVLDLSNKARYVVRSEKYRECFPEVKLREDQSTKSYFGNTAGGDRNSCTVGGSSPLGFHAHFISVDDPIDPQKAGAVSGLELKTAASFVCEVLPTRKTNKETAATILIMQRLHEIDPTGVKLQQASQPDGVQIKHICLPAELTGEKDLIKPVELKEKYVDGLMDPIRMPRKTLREFKSTLGTYAYSGQFLQSPVPLGGGMFKEIHFTNRIPCAPYQAKRIRYYDVAASAGENASFTVGTLMSYLDGIFYVEHVERGQWEPVERDEHILTTAHRDRDRYGPNFAPLIYVEKQPAAAGIDFHRHILRLLAGFPVYEDKPGASKELRAEPFASQCAGGNVRLVNDGSWDIPAWIHEHVLFPLGKWSDQVDSASAASSLLANMRPAGSLRTYTATGSNKEKTIRIVCMSKKALALEVIDEHRCILISISRPEPAGKMEMLQHGITKLIDHTELAFLDKQATDFQQFWNSPIHPYNKVPKDLVMGRDMGKKLWSCILRKRQEEIDVVVIADDGEDDRRGLSIAYAICDVLRLPKARTIFRLEHPDWHAEEGKLPEKDIFNSHIYSAAKEGRNQIVEGKLLYGMRLAKEGGYGTFK